jgi:N-acyl-L-homoserine lactone synthetase
MIEESPRLRAVFCTEEQNPEVVDRLRCFRKVLFVDALGWDLPIRNGREQDEFDTELAVHCALFRGDALIAGFRGIRTDHPYLAECVFPQLATFAPYPKRRDTWEISRFGVHPSEPGWSTGRILYSLMFELARHYRANALVAIGDLRHERVLAQLGIRTRRFGPPRSIGVDGNGAPYLVVAGETPLAVQGGRKFEALVHLVDKLEIEHDALVLGPRRVSA